MKRYIVLNTKNKGMVRIFTYKQGSKFVSVCLELDIVKENDNREDLDKEIKESVEGYIKTVCKERMDDALLNRHAPEKYWQKYETYLESLAQKTKIQQTRALSGGIETFQIPELCAA